MNFTKEVKEIIHLEYDPDDMATDKVAKAITDIHNKQIADLKMENADHRGLLRTYATENADLKSQLAELEQKNKALSEFASQVKITGDIVDEPIKYLNADEVEHIIGSINTNQEKAQAICKLAIRVDREIDWQVIASGEVKGKYQVYIGDKSIYNIENKIIGYIGKQIEIAVRVKEE